MANRDWIAFWAERGTVIEAGSGKTIPGNGFVPPFSIERAESLGLTVDGDDAAGGAPAPDVAEAAAEDVAGADEAPDASEDDAAGFAPTA